MHILILLKTHVMKRSIAIFIISLLFYSCNKEVDIVYDVIIKNGNIINLSDGSVALQNIYISNGRIVKLIKPEEDKSFKSKRILDGTNKFILPGFWDNHVHFRGGDTLIEANKDFLKLFIMNGITTVRDAGGDLTSSVMSWKNQINTSDLIGPTIFSAGPKIDGENATWAGSLVVEKEEDITKALDSLESLQVDFVKLYDSRISGDLYLKTIKEATNRGLITSGHMPFTVNLEETITSGIGAIEHMYYILKGCSLEEKIITQAIINNEYGFWASMNKLIDTYDESTANKTFSILKNHNTYVVPTLHIGDVLSYLDEENHEHDIYLKKMDPGFIKTYNGRINSALNASEEVRQNRKALNTFFKTLTKS